MIPWPVPTVPRVNWRAECSTCGAVMVAAYPGDVKLAADRRGWSGGLCRGCRRAGA